MTKDVKEQLRELIDSYGNVFHRTRNIERMEDMSTEQIYAEYEYVCDMLRSKRKMYMLPGYYGGDYYQKEKCKELIWEEFYSLRFRKAISRPHPDREYDEDTVNWEERRVRRQCVHNDCHLL